MKEEIHDLARVALRYARTPFGIVAALGSSAVSTLVVTVGLSAPVEAGLGTAWTLGYGLFAGVFLYSGMTAVHAAESVHRAQLSSLANQPKPGTEAPC